MRDSTMLLDSPYSTPAQTPPQLEVIEASTPWSDIRLEDGRTATDYNMLAPVLGTYNFAFKGRSRARQRRWSRLVWPAIAAILCSWWFLERGRETNHNAKQDLVTEQYLDQMQFIDANHPFIRYVGRWTTSSDGRHKDGAFAGVYFDFAFNGSSTVILSLHNSGKQEKVSAQTALPRTSNLAFLPSTSVSKAKPVSLLARINEEGYLVLPDAVSTVLVRKGDLEAATRHEVRIIAPMVESFESLQVKGLWIDKGCSLQSPLPLLEQDSETDSLGLNGQKNKILEVVTDTIGSAMPRDESKQRAAIQAILGGVMGWDFLLGEMFSADHVTSGLGDMCLVQDCIGGRESPIGLADVFFQSGPPGSPQYAQSWHFQDYVPDVMVFNIGNSDWESFQVNSQEYNKTIWELSAIFEETYVTMIKAIRTLAYPKYSSSVVDSSRYSYSQQGTGASIPIFIMRPLRGQLEQATQAVVERLRKEGDKSIFWLDTSGWLNTEVDFESRADDQDFFLDEQSSPKRWRLTERGNQRTAILLHMHVCRYLARDAEKCAFLPPEVYQGKAMDQEAIRLSEYIDGERERKLKKLFWD